MIIKELHLKTQNLNHQKEFYADVLGLEVTENTNNVLIIECGHTTIHLKEDIGFVPYHFAFNIPSNKILEAQMWLRERLTLIPDGDKEIINFKAWNAQALYFYDKDNNILEFIARKNLDYNSNEEFNASSIIGVSEIGVVTDDISKVYATMKDQSNIPIHSGGLERFLAVGDDTGLFIIINHLEKDYWYPTSNSPYVADFRIKFNENKKTYSLIYEKGELRLSR